MYLHTQSAKKLVSLLAAISAFVMIESAAPLAVNAASAVSGGASAVYSQSAAPASGAASYGTGTVTVDYLNVRSGRGTGYSVMCVLTKGTAVNLLEKDGSWYKINVNGKNGWISADYVKVTGASAATTASTTAAVTTTAKAATTKTTAAASSGLGTCTVTADYLYVRSGPGTKYAVVGGLGHGKTVQAVEKSGSWVKVKLSDSKSGWVYGSYVKFGTSGGTTTTTKKTTTTTKKTTTTTKKTTTTTKKTTTTTTNNSKSASSTGKIVITADALNARSSASKTASVIGTVRRNEVYAYKGVKNGFYQITIPSGETAYISSDYAKNFTDYAVKGGGAYLWPSQAYSRIRSYFGPRDGRNHYGIDIAAPGGSQIMAVASGKVIKNDYEANGFGYYVVIQQSDGICAYYGHMKTKSFLKVGASVKAGDTIGQVGSTGRSTGNHLHLEFRRGTTRINPLNYYPNMK